MIKAAETSNRHGRFIVRCEYSDRADRCHVDPPGLAVVPIQNLIALPGPVIPSRVS